MLSPDGPVDGVEKRLGRLMDFGRFLGHGRLAELAAQAEARYPAQAELSDDELEDLFAAGDPALWKRREEDDHGG